MSAPTVSVVMGVYNAGAALHEALESLRAQTERDFEIIAVDDGSTDSSGALLDEWAARDSRLRVIRDRHERDSS